MLIVYTVIQKPKEIPSSLNLSFSLEITFDVDLNQRKQIFIFFFLQLKWVNLQNTLQCYGNYHIAFEIC